MDTDSGDVDRVVSILRESLPDTRPPTILQLVPTLNEGGVERGTIDIAGAIVRAGGRALVASEGGRLEARLAQAGGRLIRLPMASKNPLRIRQNARKLEALIADEGIDLIHARSRAPAWSGYLAATRTKTPFVTTYHGTYNEGFPLKRKYNGVMALGRPTIAVSAFIAEHIAARHPIAAKDVVTIPRGTDMAVFNADAVPPVRLIQLAQAWGGESEDRPIFLLPGRLTRWKGQAVFVDACARLRAKRGPSFLGVMVGGVPDGSKFADELEEQARDGGCADCVKMVGSCADMPAAYLLSSAVISASTDPEAFGRVAVEAQAMGRAVIASDHGGSRETVEHSVTGVLVPPGDAQALFEAMDAFLDLEEDVREQLGIRARRRVQELFSVEQMIEKTLKVYEQASGRRFPGRRAPVA